MDAKSFYGARQRTLLALVPEHPEDSDADLSDNDDPIEDPDIIPHQQKLLVTVLLNPWKKKRLPQQAAPLHSRLSKKAEKERAP